MFSFSNCHIFKPACRQTGFQILKMNKISNYFRESYLELTEKVTWPTWMQLQQSTGIVLVATIIITALVWIMDFASQNLLKAVYSLFK
jgi:preprotein translocase subunit SecE